MDEFWINELTEEFRKKIFDIVNVWVEIGITNEKLITRSSALKQHVDNLLNDMLMEEHRHKQEVEKSIKTLTDDIKELCSSLQMDYDFNSEESLVKKENTLLKKKNEITTFKEARVKKFHSLLNMEEKLCERLYEYQLNLDRELIPTEQQLKDFEKKIQDLENLKKDRTSEFLLKRKIIMKCYNLLYKNSPKDAIIESIFNDEDVVYVPLSNDFLIQCDRIINQLNVEYQKNIHDCTKLRERYEILHDMLNPSVNTVISSHLSKHSDDFSNETLNLLKKDVLHLENCRREKIGEFIKNHQYQIRQKLRNNFSSHLEMKENYVTLLNSEEVSESFLEQLETELEKWRFNEKELEPLHREMEVWEKLFNRLIEININLKDPIILKNRGGILLKVEKEKNAVKKELPKTEAKIRKILMLLEGKNINHCDLKINDMELKDYILHMWDQVEGEKENERKDRKIKNENTKLDVSKTSSSVFKKPLKVSQQNSSSSKLIKSEFKNPEAQKFQSKIPMKKNVLSPISKVKTNLDRRFSKSYNSLDMKISRPQLTGSNNNLYALFCKDVKGAAMTSSFVEDISTKRK